MLVYDSRLRLFPGSLKSRWRGPFAVREVFPHGAVKFESGDHTWKVNGHRLKPYIGGPIPTDEEVILLESRAG